MSGSRGRDEVQSAAESAASNTAETIAREGKRVVDAAGDEAKEFVSERVSKATDYLKDLSSAMEQGRRRLDDDGHHTSARMIDRFASDVNEVAREISDRSAADLLRELERFAHRRPAMFFGAALLAGFGAARFFKSARAESTGDVSGIRH